MKEIRVAIFEDNRSLRESLFNLLESAEGFTCAGAFAHCERVVENKIGRASCRERVYVLV